MVTIPSGTYDHDAFINVSRNYWALDSQMALTWVSKENGLEVSGKGGLIVNSPNTDTDYRTGNELHMEGLIAKHIDKRFSYGIVGYYYDQVSADTGRGTLSGDFNGLAFGTGPVLRYCRPFFSHNVMLKAKWLHDCYAKDRFEGDYFFMSVATRF